MNNRIVTAEGAVIHSLAPSATIAKLMEAASTPAVFDADTMQETSAKSYPAADTVYEEVDIDEVALRDHKWLTSRYDTEEWAALRAERDRLLAASDWPTRRGLTRRDLRCLFLKYNSVPASIVKARLLQTSRAGSTRI